MLFAPLDAHETCDARLRRVAVASAEAERRWWAAREAPECGQKLFPIDSSSPRHIAEFLQMIVVLARRRLNFLRSEVRLHINLENSRNHPFPALDHFGRGAQTNATDECMDWYERARVFERVLHGIDEQPRTFVDETEYSCSS